MVATVLAMVATFVSAFAALISAEAVFLSLAHGVLSEVEGLFRWRGEMKLSIKTTGRLQESYSQKGKRRKSGRTEGLKPDGKL